MITVLLALLLADVDSAPVPLPHVVERDGLRLAADVPLPMERLADQAVRDLARVDAAFRAFPVARNLPPLRHLYFTSDPTRVDALLTHHGLAVTPYGGRARTDLEVGAIFIVGDEREDHQHILAHELAHAALAKKTRRRGTFIEEGLAEALADWLVFGGSGKLGEVRVESLTRIRDAARALRERRPSLESLVRMTNAEFHREERRDEHYDLAWSFIQFVLTTDDPELAGRFGKLVGTLAHGRPGSADDDWKNLAEVADIERLEHQWRRAVLEWARRPWQPRTGAWYAVEDRLAMFMSGSGSGILLWGDRRQSPRGTIAFGLATELPEDGVQAGVVLGHRGPDDHVIGTIDRGGTRFGLIRRENGRFGQWKTFDLPPGPRTLEVRVDRSEVRLVRGDEELARHEFPPAALRGSFGLYAERKLGKNDPWVPGRVVFRDVRVER